MGALIPPPPKAKPHKKKDEEVILDTASPAERKAHESRPYLIEYLYLMLGDEKRAKELVSEAYLAVAEDLKKADNFIQAKLHLFLTARSFAGGHWQSNISALSRNSDIKEGLLGEFFQAFEPLERESLLLHRRYHFDEKQSAHIMGITQEAFQKLLKTCDRKIQGDGLSLGPLQSLFDSPLSTWRNTRITAPKTEALSVMMAKVERSKGLVPSWGRKLFTAAWVGIVLGLCLGLYAAGARYQWWPELKF